MTPTAFAASAFTDVPDTHWASSYIQRAYEKGWVNGMSQTIYAPSDSLTRAQFLKMSKICLILHQFIVLQCQLIDLGL